MKRPTRRAAVLAVGAAALGAGVIGLRTLDRTVPAPVGGASQTTRGEIARSTFVGAERCGGCHAAEMRAWSSSDHANAMRPANATSVAGDFESGTYSYANTLTSFRRTATGYEVTTDGADGGLATYPVTFTFGARPLEQYLVPFGGGRLQVLPIAWDTRPKAQGGGRWFHVYPDETTTFRDALHWTGPSQNWNSACAECHTTDFKKNYRAESRTYETTHAELGVSCEACHGPGSAHVAWANGADHGADPTAGFAVRLGGETLAWGFDGGPIAVRRSALPNETQVETCGRCHARRAPIWAEHRPGAPLADTHRVALLEEGLYFPDGQIEEEVYEYGSFLQSKMHARGVMCTNCHEPHTGAVRQRGNALCAQCHAPTTFDTPAHTMHSAASAGARCVACHMPSRIYMRVDLRRDHSFRVPRPDLSQELGAPDACTTSCHEGKGSAWAAKAIANHYAAPKRPAHYGQAIASGRAWKADARARLLDVVRDRSVPPIARATAIALLQRFPAPEVLAQGERSTSDPDPLVRRAAVGSLDGAPPAVKLRVLRPLLADPTRSVRLATAIALAGAPGMDPTQDRVFSGAVDEARTSLRDNADRADARVELANLEARLGRRDLAERELREALEVQRTFVPAYVNLADLFRLEGRDEDGIRLLERGLAAAPDSAMIERALGLALVRRGRTKDALAHLAKSAELAPDDPMSTYAWAVALHGTGDGASAVRVLESAAVRFPGHQPTRDALTAYAERHR